MRIQRQEQPQDTSSAVAPTAGAVRSLAPTLRRYAGLSVLLAACAVPPLQPDLSAKAPSLEGFGSTSFAPDTTSPVARQRFQDGVLQAWAFNEREAVRQFKAALAADPACALCAWGVAWQLGPNINSPQRGELRDAQQYIDYAVRHMATASPRIRAFIEAMALRYGHSSMARELAPLQAPRCGKGGEREDEPDPLDVAYAQRLHEMLQRTPDDAELLTLWAEAEMIATPGDWYDKNRQPLGRIGELADRLERALQREPNHTGLNHYLIHAVDEPGVAQRAVAAADRLGALAPGAPHLVHMPAHTYAQVGRYADAARVNEQAVALDVKLREVQKAQGFENSKDWTQHNLHFQWFGELMEGRGDAALASARKLAQRAEKWQHAYGEYVRSLPALTLLRLQRWQALEAEPAPAGTIGVAQALHGHAKAIALIERGRLADAKTALAEVVDANVRLAKAHPGAKGFDPVLRGMGDMAQARLMAEIALAESQPEAAFAQQRKAVEAAEKADSSEPPMLAGGALWALGQMQLRAGRATDAEATFRNDLQRWPNSGWSLAGLSKAVQAQGKAADTQATQALAAKAWPRADLALR